MSSSVVEDETNREKRTRPKRPEAPHYYPGAYREKKENALKQVASMDKKSNETSPNMKITKSSNLPLNISKVETKITPKKQPPTLDSHSSVTVSPIATKISIDKKTEGKRNIASATGTSQSNKYVLHKRSDQEVEAKPSIYPKTEGKKINKNYTGMDQEYHESLIVSDKNDKFKSTNTPTVKPNSTSNKRLTPANINKEQAKDKYSKPFYENDNRSGYSKEKIIYPKVEVTHSKEQRNYQKQETKYPKESRNYSTEQIKYIKEQKNYSKEQRNYPDEQKYPKKQTFYSKEQRNHPKDESDYSKEQMNYPKEKEKSNISKTLKPQEKLNVSDTNHSLNKKVENQQFNDSISNKSSHKTCDTPLKSKSNTKPDTEFYDKSSVLNIESDVSYDSSKTRGNGKNESVKTIQNQDMPQRKTKSLIYERSSKDKCIDNSDILSKGTTSTGISPKSQTDLIHPKIDKSVKNRNNEKPPSKVQSEMKQYKNTNKDYKEDKKNKHHSPKSENISKAHDFEASSVSEISGVLRNIDFGDYTEESTNESEDYSSGNDKDKKKLNPIDCYKSNSFYENDARNITEKNLRGSSRSQNVAWEDEKWSPSQKQRKKKSKNSPTKESESPGRRGIIQIPNTPANADGQAEAVTPGQRLLFNPLNPSKPVAVMPSARDLHPSWDSPHGHDKDKNTDEAVSGGPALNESNPEGEGTCGLDPSIFYNIQKGELDINYFVNSNQLPQEFKRIMDIRIHLQSCYKQLLITDIRLCQEKNVEGALWKSLYYIIIEKLREYISCDPTLKERSWSTLMMIVADGLCYLDSLIQAIQKAYRFSLDAHIEEDLTSIPGTKNRVRQALYSCQKILLSMGDLARYKEQYNPNPNYANAKKYYEKALQVNPKNGRPFNQLAIIAVSQKRSLDVVYYYIRSLTASNPFTSARDSLISMFDDIRRKYESMNISTTASGTPSKNQNGPAEAQQIRRDCNSLRQEIWIRPDSGATNKRTLSQSDPDEEKKSRIEELLRLPQDQLMKQFLTSYLHCHGMLFSRVGLDHFIAVLGDTVNLFQALLQLTPPKLSPMHLLQILAINMFAVDNTQLRDARLESGYRSAAQDLALLLSQEMFARLAEVMVKLFPTCLNYTVRDPVPHSTPSTSPAKEEGGSAPAASPITTPAGFSLTGADSQRLFETPLIHFIPAAKVWCDWLLYQSSIWNPPPISHDISGVDTWGVVGELATIVKGIGPPDVNLSEEGPAPHLVPVTLPEDVFLRGYAPIVSAQGGVHYAPANKNKERAQDWVRVKKLQLCLSQFLCGVEPPILRLQKTDQGEILVPVVAVSPPDSPAVSRSSIGSCEVDLEDSNSEGEGSISDDEGEIGAAMEVGGGEDTPLASTVRLLALRKKQLEKRQKQQRKMQAILEGAVTLEMEVKPRYLVPDTNCFIEKLNIIKALVDTTNYTFMVPLIVLAELDGLSRDAAVEKYGDAAHAVNVREGAATALHFVQSNKNPRLKCVTSQGSVAPSNMFSLEMDTLKDITNDDKILSCCLHLCSDTIKKRPIKEGVRRLHREVVLLTEDRNLRVKAYARDVPVRELSDFAHWAGVK